MDKIYQILYEIEIGNLEQAFKLTEALASDTLEKKASKLLCYGEIYYNDLEFSDLDKSFIRNLGLSVIEEIDFNQKMMTENVALYYSGLKLANLLVKSDEISETVSQLRNYIFENNIIKGTLVAKKGDGTHKTSVLRTCTPYPLFEPEDLIVVAAYHELLSDDIFKFKQEGIIDIILYAIDKRDIYIAKKYFDFYQQNYSQNNYGYRLAQKRLEQILEDEIIHQPYGNNHPYLPQKFERLPRNPYSGKEIILNVVTENLADLLLELKVNGDSIQEFSGTIQNDIINYKSYQIGPFEANTEIEYRFKTNNIESDLYQFKVAPVNQLVVENIMKNRVSFVGLQRQLIISKDTNNNYHFNWDELNLNNNNGVNVIKKEDQLVIDDKFKIDLTSCSIISGEIKTFDLAFITTKETKFFGFGERYNEVCQENNVIDNYVYSQYKEQGIKTYIPMPIGFTNQGYAMFVNGYSNAKFLVQDEKISIQAKLDEELIIITGNYEKQITDFHGFNQKPEKLPNYVFGPWMSSNNWDSQKEVLKQKDLTLKYDIPSTVLVIEQWSDEATFYAFNDAKYQEKKSGFHTHEEYEYNGKWPNPKAMVDELHDADLKCFLWQIPVIKYVPNIRHLQKNLDEKFAIENNYVVKHQNNQPYRIAEDWFKDSLVIDFTNEEAKKWWFDKRKYLTDEIGIDGFKTDGGECLFGHDLILNNETNPDKVRNLYPETYIQAYYQFLKEHTQDGFTFSRAGYKNAASYPAHWAGDERSTFAAFDRTIKAGINAGISGITYWGWDLAGFNGDIPTAELFIRSTQMATFCPIMQYHAESKGEFNQDRTPWNIAERTKTPEVIDIYRFYAQLRMQLIPYIVKEANKALAGGKPLMRAMFLEHDEEFLYEITDQYYFGDDLLVAPVTEPGVNKRNVYLPEPMINAFSLERYSQGTSEVEFKLDSFPLFFRENRIIPLNLKNKFGQGMKNSDYQNFSDLKYLYTGGNVNYCDENVNISIENGKIRVIGEMIKIIDITDTLEGEVIATINWAQQEVPIKQYN